MPDSEHDPFGQIPSVRDRRAERAAMEAKAKEKAQAAWKTATDNQKTGIRFGMTDVDLIKKAGYNPHGRDESGEQRAFTLALMDCATADGGMRA